MSCSYVCNARFVGAVLCCTAEGAVVADAAGVEYNVVVEVAAVARVIYDVVVVVAAAAVIVRVVVHCVFSVAVEGGDNTPAPATPRRVLAPAPLNSDFVPSLAMI